MSYSLSLDLIANKSFGHSLGTVCQNKGLGGVLDLQHVEIKMPPA